MVIPTESPASLIGLTIRACLGGSKLSTWAAITEVYLWFSYPIPISVHIIRLAHDCFLLVEASIF